LQSSTVFTPKLQKYKAILWQGQAVFKHYAKLKNHLKQNLGDDIASLFAEPHIPGNDAQKVQNGTWSSETIGAKAIAMSALDESRKSAANALLLTKLAKLQRYIDDLTESGNPENVNWAQLISKALEIPGEDHILVDGDNIAFVVWGFEYEVSSYNQYSLKDSFFKPLPPRDKKTVPPATEPAPQGDQFVQPPVQDAFDTQEVQRQEDNTTKDNTAKADNTTVKVEQPIVQDDRGAPKEVKPADEKLPGTTGTVNKKKKSFWRRYWWFLPLLLLLLLLLLWLLTRREKVDPVLPPEPGRLVPIDTTKIVEDSSKLKKIVADRLNVILAGDNKNLQAFAQKFKQLYPGKEYGVIYYDTIVYHLQILMPAAERNKIKSELPGKMPEFELLIFEETIQTHANQPSDPGFSNPVENWYHREIQAFQAWDISRGDPNIVVAIIDDGFDLTHPEFRGKIYKPWNVVARSSNVNTGRKSYHGTHVAGIALGLADNGQGVCGIAPNCKFMPVQVGDYDGVMSSSAIIDGILYAVNHGANVINMSLGMSMPESVRKMPVQTQQYFIDHLYKDEEVFWNQLFAIAYKKNVTIVLAAGNENVLIGLDPMQRSRSTIKVSAVGPDESKADFSNFGPSSTISAPGVHIYSSVPRASFAYLDGTSMAAPVVTGGIAVLKSINPALTTQQIVNLLQSTGKRVNLSNGYMGNIIQLASAARIADVNRKKTPRVYCTDVQRKIDSLTQEIEKLKQECGSNTAADTLRIPPNNNNLNFAVGRWKSTTTIVDVRTNQPVTIYFDFNSDMTGQVTLVGNNNTQCSADLKLSLRSSVFTIDQIAEAQCSPPPSHYRPYTFVCRPNANGVASCTAQNKTNANNKFDFNLVKIK